MVCGVVGWIKFGDVYVEYFLVQAYTYMCICFMEHFHICSSMSGFFPVYPSVFQYTLL